MKSKVYAIYTCIILSIVSFVSMCVVNNYYSECDYLDILFASFSGVFASTITSLIIFISEYFTIRTEYLERYWYQINLFLNRLYDIRVLSISYDLDYFLNVAYSIRYDTEKCKWLTNDINNIGIIDEADKELYNNYILCKSSVLKAISDYMKIIDFDFFSIDNTYSNICFFTSFKKNKEKLLYNRFNEKLRPIYREIKFNKKMFDDYSKGLYDDLFKVLLAIIELQNKIFRIEKETDNDNIISYKYYNEIHKQLSDDLENFRAKTIYKTTPQYIDDYPVFEYLKDKE